MSPNHFWSLDFMSDTLWYGKKYRLLNIMDEFNRELLDVTVDTSLPAHSVIETLDRLIAEGHHTLSVWTMEQSLYQHILSFDVQIIISFWILSDLKNLQKTQGLNDSTVV